MPLTRTLAKLARVEALCSRLRVLIHARRRGLHRTQKIDMGSEQSTGGGV